MIIAGFVDDAIKQQILDGLKPIATEDKYVQVNGDIKEWAKKIIWDLITCTKLRLTKSFLGGDVNYEFQLIWQPDNILVDYSIKKGKVTEFIFVLADWGTSGDFDQHFGGTPVYASGNAFIGSVNKDIFAFGRIAAELYLPQSGNINKVKIIFYSMILFC